MKGYKDIPGWFNFRDFYDFIVGKMPNEGANILELGVYFGASSTYLVDALERANKTATVHLVDLFDDNYMGPDARRICGELGMSHLQAFQYYADRNRLFFRPGIDVKWHQGDSRLIADVFEKAETKFDFVYIDTEHTYEILSREIDLYRPMVKPGGYLGGHDYCQKFPGVEKAVKEKFPDSFYLHHPSCWYTQL